MLLSVGAKLEPCPSRGVSAACATLMLGVILVSCGAGGEVGALAVGITLLSALFSACHVITIRRAMTKMMESARTRSATNEPEQKQAHEEAPEEQVGLLSPPEGQTDKDSHQQCSGHQTTPAGYNGDRVRKRAPDDKLPSAKVPELLMLKMLLSMIFLVPAAILEQTRLTETSSDAVTAWAVLTATPESNHALMDGMHFSRSCVVPALAVGVFFTMAFQGMMLAMATRIHALSIGFVAQCKVLP